MEAVFFPYRGVFRRCGPKPHPEGATTEGAKTIHPSSALQKYSRFICNISKDLRYRSLRDDMEFAVFFHRWREFRGLLKRLQRKSAVRSLATQNGSRLGLRLLFQDSTSCLEKIIGLQYQRILQPDGQLVQRGEKRLQNRPDI